MSKLLFWVVLLGQFACVDALSAQTIREFACPTRLQGPFFNYQPVRYGSGSYLSDWDSEIKFDIPSKNWYKAYPETTIKSEDGSLKWHQARLQLWCYDEKTIYYTRTHYDIIDYDGWVEILQCRTDGGGPVDNELDSAYDPYSPESSVSADCTPSGGSGGSSATCSTELIIIERNDGYGWYEIWRGYVEVCEA